MALPPIVLCPGSAPPPEVLTFEVPPTCIVVAVEPPVLPPVVAVVALELEAPPEPPTLLVLPPTLTVPPECDVLADVPPAVVAPPVLLLPPVLLDAGKPLEQPAVRVPTKTNSPANPN